MVKGEWCPKSDTYNFMLIQMFKFGEFSFADFEIENFLSQKKYIWECVLLSSQQFIQCKHGTKTYMKWILFKKFIHFIRWRINIIIGIAISIHFVLNIASICNILEILLFPGIFCIFWCGLWFCFFKNQTPLNMRKTRLVFMKERIKVCFLELK